MAEIVELPGFSHRFVAGLYWRHEDRLPRTSALARASAEFGRWGLSRKTSLGSFQSGYLEPLSGLKSPRGLLSLAAILADVRPEPWQGIYDLGDGRFWLIAVRDNQEILPRGDIIGDFDTIERLSAELASLGDDWDFARGTAEDLANLLRDEVPKRQRYARIGDLQRSRVLTSGLLSVAIVAGMALTGRHFWLAHEREIAMRRAAALAQRMAIEAAMQAHAAARAAAAHVPWESVPQPNVVLDACEATWDRQPVNVAGWNLTDWRCAVAGPRVGVDTWWKIVGGSPMDAPGVLDSGARTSHAAALGRAIAVEGPSIALPREQALRALFALGTSYGVQVSVAQPPQAPVSKSSGPAPEWSVLRVRIESIAPLWALGLGDALDGIAGLRLTQVSWSPTGGAPWAAAGDLYTR
ncbi:MAG: type 4b pilus protein PilO2 [Burkholderiales bacterium]|nr:type 4b pilus protein PilO2 [Burkholderiales bacterium]